MGKKLRKEKKQFKRKALRDNEGGGKKESDMPEDEGASEERLKGKEEEFRRAHGLYGWTLVASDQRLANSRLS